MGKREGRFSVHVSQVNTNRPSKQKPAVWEQETPSGPLGYCRMGLKTVHFPDFSTNISQCGGLNSGPLLLEDAYVLISGTCEYVASCRKEILAEVIQ